MQPAIDRLATATDKAVPVWRQAGQATTADDYIRLMSQTSSLADQQDAKVIRTALGLSTAQGQPPNSATPGVTS